MNCVKRPSGSPVLHLLCAIGCHASEVWSLHLKAKRRGRQLSIKSLIKIVLVPAGFLLCFVAVILPWRVRNVYLKVLVGPACNIVLSSDVFISFFMEAGFATERPSRSR